MGMDPCIKYKRRLAVPGNRLLKITYGTEREEVTWSQTKLRTEELHNLHSSLDVDTVIGIESTDER